jgi:hypothetical protein
MKLTPDYAKVQRLQEVAMKKHSNGNEKKVGYSLLGQDTFRVSRKVLSAPGGRLMSL